MPLPIPKPTSVAGIPDPHYMTFDEAVKHPFTDEHQPSLQNRMRKNNTAVDGDVSLGERETRTSSEAETNKVTQGKFIRGIDSCKDGMKPRCLYSVISPNRMKPYATIGDPEPTAYANHVCREYAMDKLRKPKIASSICAGCNHLMLMTRCIYGVILGRVVRV
jgi:hypothetical protein